MWCAAFGTPHTWWALGFPWAFPGGAASYRFFMSSAWRVTYDVVVVVMSVIGMLVSLTLLRPPATIVRRWIPYSAAWFACGILSFRGIGGIIIERGGDHVWSPTFVVGGILFGAVAWLARQPGGGTTSTARTVPPG
jgi:hypothetical protein